MNNFISHSFYACNYPVDFNINIVQIGYKNRYKEHAKHLYFSFLLRSSERIKKTDQITSNVQYMMHIL